MSCDFTEQVSSMIDGELPANEASRVERHVITCFECQETRAVFLKMRREISDYQITLEPQAQERVLAEILANRGTTTPRQIATIGWCKRFVAAFAAPRFATAWATVLILVGLAGFMIYRNTQREPAIARLPTNDQGPANDRPAPPTAPVPQPSREAVDGTLASNDQKPGMSSKRDTAAGAPGTQRMRRVPSPLLRRPQANSAPAFAVASASTKSNGGLVSSADPETLTAQHVEQSSLLLRAFRNAHVEDNDELTYEINRAGKLLYQNILLRREATTKGNVQVASLLDSLEPILIDIANLQASPGADEVRTIQQRMERQNLVPLLQVNATQLARALD